MAITSTALTDATASSPVPAPPVRLVRQLAAATVAVVIIALLMTSVSPAPAPPKPGPAWSGRIGPAALAVGVAPAAAGAPAQVITLTFTRPKTTAPYDVPTTVSSRLTPKQLTLVLPDVPAGGPPKPVKATKTGPGVWTIKLAGDAHVALPGTWTLKVSALVAPGHAIKQSIPLTFG